MWVQVQGPVKVGSVEGFHLRRPLVLPDRRPSGSVALRGSSVWRFRQQAQIAEVLQQRAQAFHRVYRHRDQILLRLLPFPCEAVELFLEPAGE